MTSIRHDAENIGRLRLKFVKNFELLNKIGPVVGHSFDVKTEIETLVRSHLVSLSVSLLFLKNFI